MHETRRRAAVRARCLAVAAFAALPGIGASWAAPATPMLFDQAFRAGERGALHFEATYLARGREHHLESWRDGATRLKRVTDGDVETYVAHRPGDAEFSMTLLDKRRKLSTRIDRSNLYRIGSFTDWFDLAHGLRHPKGDYSLSRAAAPAGAPAAAHPCTWYALTQNGHASQVCWSAQHSLPMLVVAGDQVVWRVTKLDAHRIAPGTFLVDDRGYVRNDANLDIERD